MSSTQMKLPVTLMVGLMALCIASGEAPAKVSVELGVGGRIGGAALTDRDLGPDTSVGFGGGARAWILVKPLPMVGFGVNVDFAGSLHGFEQAGGKRDVSALFPSVGGIVRFEALGFVALHMWANYVFGEQETTIAGVASSASVTGYHLGTDFLYRVKLARGFRGWVEVGPYVGGGELHTDLPGDRPTSYVEFGLVLQMTFQLGPW